MGWRIHKSIKISKNLRINLSKSGASLSGGVKGARVSVNTKGVVRKSVGIPGTSVYYSDQHKIGGKSSNSNVNGEVLQTTKMYSKNKSKRITRSIPWYLVLFVFAISGHWFVGGVIFLILLIMDFKKYVF